MVDETQLLGLFFGLSWGRGLTDCVRRNGTLEVFESNTCSAAVLTALCYGKMKTKSCCRTGVAKPPPYIRTISSAGRVRLDNACAKNSSAWPTHHPSPNKRLTDLPYGLRSTSVLLDCVVHISQQISHNPTHQARLRRQHPTMQVLRSSPGGSLPALGVPSNS